MARWTHFGLLAVWSVSAGCLLQRAQPTPPPPVERLLAEGSAVPEISALGVDGKPVALTGFGTRFVVFYFYPLDFASGATAQAEEFRADHARYRKLGATIVGVSTDDPETHKEFSRKHKLPFPLLSDRSGDVARAFGLPLHGGTTRHATFLADRRGVVRKVWPKVRPWGHSAEVLEVLRALSR